MSTSTLQMNLPSGRRRKGLLLQRQSTSKQNKYLNSTQWNSHKYDESTGQVFTERTARILSASDRAWTRRTWVVYDRNDEEEAKQLEAAKAWEARKLGKFVQSQSSTSEALASRNKGGARSLQNTALEQVIQNISDLTIDSFEYLPITLVKRIWDIARKRCAISFETWALFSRILYNEDYISEDLLQYAEAFSEPKVSLEMYTKPLTSESFDFITSLCITTPFTVPDLTKLASIRNLGVLEIVNMGTSSTVYAQMGVGDRLIRSWHEAATNDEAFPVLRVLRLWNHEALTTQSLVYLNGFPSLAVYDVRGCGLNSQAKSIASSLGWKGSIETDVLKILERTCAKRTEVLRKQKPVSKIPGSGTKVDHEQGDDDIRWISKDEVNDFLTTCPPPRSIQPQQFTLKSEPAFPRRAQNKDVKIAYRQEDHFLQRSQKLDAWEASAYKAYARIGELRGETDLERVGVLIPDFVVKGDELLNPIPMVLVRLGKSVSSLMLTMKTSNHAQSFVRIQAPSEEMPYLSSSAERSSQKQTQGATNLALRATSSSRAPSSSASSTAVNTQPSLQKSKKRRLDEVLGSFF